MTLHTDYGKVLCPKCSSPLGAFDACCSRFECGSCGSEFPVVKGRFPVLMEDWRGALIASRKAHEAFIADNEKTIAEARKAIKANPGRAELLNRAIHAYQGNNRYFGETLRTVRELLHAGDSSNSSAQTKRWTQYPIENGLSCFIRDWAWEPCTEREVATTTTTLFSLAEEYAADLDSVFVPGAGTGRFAREAARRYDECYALDSSFQMVNDFYNVLAGEVVIHEINLHRGVARSEDVVRERRLSFFPRSNDPSALKPLPDNLCFFVGDALAPPFPDRFFSTVMCIYFIDIVPIRAQVEQAARLLKPGGLFLNFGPLRYIKGDINDMLSGEEILAAFEDAGFDILASDVVTNSQFADTVGLTQIESRNFVFAARKRLPAR